jgi:tellurite resistance protein TerC
MYFGPADLMTRIRLLHEGLAAILLFTGAKMLVSDRFAIPAAGSLGVIVLILSYHDFASWLASRSE